MASFALDFTLRQGGFTLELPIAIECRALVLFGPSGSGKTSALEAIAGLRAPERGRIAIGGTTFFDHDARVNMPPRLRRVGYVPQDVLLFPHLDVRANVRYGGRDGHPDEQTLVDLLDLGTLMNRKVDSLSGGERQRVAIARALYSRPQVLLLDEPLAAVDLPRRTRIVEALLRIRDELQLPLIHVTHSPDEARAIADHAVVLDGGRVVGAGAPADVLPA